MIAAALAATGTVEEGLTRIESVPQDLAQLPLIAAPLPQLVRT
jgi:hypothetical protein